MKHCPSHILHSALCIAALAAFAANAAEPFIIARRGAPFDCAIVVPTNAHECVMYAAAELQKYTKQMTGVVLPIFEEVAQPSPVKAVVLGLAQTPGQEQVEGQKSKVESSARVSDADCRMPGTAAGEPPAPPGSAPSGRMADSFRLHIDGQRLCVTGGGPRGVLYGVYDLLERFGGCDWFAPWCEVIPESEEFAVPENIDIAVSPAFAWRETGWRHAFFNHDFAAKMRLNGWRSADARHGGDPLNFPRGFWCHTFYGLVSPKDVFAEHPEWFSEIDGRRVGDRAQLCCTNPDLAKFVAARIKEILRSNPQSRAISISQNDNRRQCQCEKCRSVAEMEESGSGPILILVNAVAEEIEKEFPAVLVQTLAYEYSRKPPKNIRPRKNVAICLCPVECSYSVPFTESLHPLTMSFVKDLEGWSAICENIFLYNYSTNFRNYLFPFPNIMTIGPNYRFARENGVKWIYDLADAGGYHGEFAELKCWLQSKLMWNPDQPVEPLIARFMSGFYGAAAPIVRNYYDELYARFAAEPEQNHPDPYAEPATSGIFSENLPQLKDEFLDNWIKQFDYAEKEVDGDPIRIYNVRMASMPVVYVRLKRIYEQNYKTVWVTANPVQHIVGMNAIKPLAAKLIALCDEAAESKRIVALAENRGRNQSLKTCFRDIADWTPPTSGCTSAEIPLKSIRRNKSKKSWRFPIREIAADDGASYSVRAHLRPQRNGLLEGGFSAGVDVEFLSNATEGKSRIVFAKDRISPDWAWYDIGEYDFSALQKIHRPTMDGLSLYIEGEVEVDKVEIAKVK